MSTEIIVIALGIISIIVAILQIAPARNRIFETIKSMWIKITNVPIYCIRQLKKRRARAEYSDLFSDTDTWLLEACKCLEVAHQLFEKLCVTEEDKVLLKEFSDRIGILKGQRDMLKWKRQGLAMGDWDGFRGNKRV